MTFNQSLTQTPYFAVSTDGRRSYGHLVVKVDSLMIPATDLADNINQAFTNTARKLGLDPNEELTPEKLAKASIHAATQLYVGAHSLLGGFYDIAKEAYLNGWYLGTPGTVLVSRKSKQGENEDEDERRERAEVERMNKLRDEDPAMYRSECWRMWVDQVCQEIRVQGYTGNLPMLKSDMTTKIPALLELPSGAVEIRIIKTGERSAVVEANGVTIEVPDLYGEKIPVMSDITKAARALEVGDQAVITKDVNPDYFIDNSKLIREMGAQAVGADPEKAQKLVALAAVASTPGLRKIFTEEKEARAKGRVEKAVTTDGEKVIQAYPLTEEDEAWTLAVLDPRYAMVIENED